jgi:hypothetical protein
MKLPAAPALWGLVSEGVMDREWVLLHDIVDGA